MPAGASRVDPAAQRDRPGAALAPASGQSRPAGARRLGRMKTPAQSQPEQRPAPTEFVATLVPLEPGFYAFSLAAETRWRTPVVGLALPAVHVCAPPDCDG